MKFIVTFKKRFDSYEEVLKCLKEIEGPNITWELEKEDDSKVS